MHRPRRARGLRPAAASDQPRATGAKRDANGQFARAPQRSREAQRGDVRAGDQEDDRGHAKGRENRRPYAAFRFLRQQRDAGRQTAIRVGMRANETVVQHADLGARSIERDAVSQPRKEPQRSAAAIRPSWIQLERHPQLGLRLPERRESGSVSASRRRPCTARRSAERAFRSPRGSAPKRRVHSEWPITTRCESPLPSSGPLQLAPSAGATPSTSNSRGLTCSAGMRSVRPSADRFADQACAAAIAENDRAHPSQVEVIRRRDRVVHVVAMEDGDQPVRCVVRKRLEQDRPDHREKRGRRADAQCQRERSGDGEATRAHKRSSGVSKILQQRVHGTPPDFSWTRCHGRR